MYKANTSFLRMIIKNLTFVVPVQLVDSFLATAFKATDSITQWVENISVLKLIEQVDPESLNFALQLSFANTTRLEAFDKIVLNSLLEEIQTNFPQELLYFESHLEKVF